MAILLLSIPPRTAGSSSGYADDRNIIIQKINELAFAMAISPLSIIAAVGAGNPAADTNTMVAKVNELIGLANGGGTTTPTTVAITSIDPTSAKAGDTIILTGTGFTGALNVLFAGVAVGSGKFQVLSATQITVTVPTVSAGSNPVQVVGASATSPARAFIVQAAAANVIPVASVNQPAAITLPANQVVLSGSGTDSDGTVTGYAWRQVTGPVNAVGLPASVANVAVSGLSSAGTYQFGFKVQDDKGAFSTEQFVNVTVNPAVGASPAITSFTPTSGYVGNTTTVSGTNLAGIAAATINGVTVVTKGGNSATSIILTVPAGATTGRIVLTNADGSTAISPTDFTVLVASAGAPKLNKFTPLSGKTGDVITVEGANLNGLSAFTIGATAAQVTPVSAGSFTFVVPTGASTDFLLATNSSGTGQSNLAFTVNSTDGDTLNTSQLNYYDATTVDAPAPNGGAYRRYSALARTDITTDSSMLAVTIDLEFGGYGHLTFLSVFDENDNYVTSFQPTGSGRSVVNVPLPVGSGVRRLTFVLGGSVTSGNQDFLGVFISQIKRLNGSVLSHYTRPKATNAIAYMGDSIHIGDGTLTASRYGFVGVERRLYTSAGLSVDTSTSGWGGRFAWGQDSNGSLSTPALQDAEAQRIATFLNGRNGRKILRSVLGTNDFGYAPADPVATATAIAAVWDKVRALVPTLELQSYRLFSRTDSGKTESTTNEKGFTLQDYRNALAAEVAKRSWARTVDTSGWWDPTQGGDDTGDGLHPNNAGNKKIADESFKLTTALSTVPALPENPALNYYQPSTTFSSKDAGLKINTIGKFELFGSAGGAYSGGIYYSGDNPASYWFYVLSDTITVGTLLQANGGLMNVLLDGQKIGSYTTQGSGQKQYTFAFPSQKVWKVEFQRDDSFTGTIWFDQATV